MMDPNNSSDAAHLAYKSVFDGDPFPTSMEQTGEPGPFDLMKGTSKVITINLLTMHFNGEVGAFIDEANYSGGNVEQGNIISTFNAGYSIVILKQVVEEFAGTPLETDVLNALTAHANFFNQFSLGGAGRFYNSFTIGAGANNSQTNVEARAAAVKGLLSAYQITGNNDFLNAAESGYNYLIDNFYNASKSAFKTTEDSNTAQYTPLKFAAISGALREASLVLNQVEAPAIYTRFFKTVENKMQLSEDANSGESGNDSDGDGIPYIPEQPDNLPPVFASEAILDLVTSVG